MAKAKEKERIEPADAGPLPSGFTEPPPPAPPLKPEEPATRKVRVTLPNTHVGVIEVEIPRDTPPEKLKPVAVAAAKEARGIVSFGVDPQVEPLD